MQIVIYKEKDVLGKLSTRDLYEENFDIGDVEFVNYYYDEIIKRNVVVAMIDDESKVISMVHLNPYLYNISGKERWVHYLVAIATRKDYRKKGYMSRVLDEALKYLQNLHEPFCYVVPISDAVKGIYERFGFEEVCKFTLDKFSDDAYDIYPVKTEEYLNLMKKEQYFLDLEDESYKASLQKKPVMIKLLDTEDISFKSIEMLKNKKIYVCQEV